MATAPSMPPSAAALVRRYYTYAGIYTLAASIIWGINTLFLLDAGLSIAEVFFANAAFSVGTVLFEIPTGVVADTLGRRASFLLSVLVLAALPAFYTAHYFLLQANQGWPVDDAPPACSTRSCPWRRAGTDW